MRRDFFATDMPIRRIAATHGVSVSAIGRRAKRDGWQRGAFDHGAGEAARALYADLTRELERGLARLRMAAPAEEPGKAAERATLIRAHRRALLALLEAAGERRRDRAEAPDGPASLDLAAARREVLKRLERLGRAASPGASA